MEGWENGFRKQAQKVLPFQEREYWVCGQISFIPLTATLPVISVCLKMITLIKCIFVFSRGWDC